MRASPFRVMNANAHLAARPRRLMTGPYLARHPVVVGAMALSDLVGRLAPRRASAATSDGLLGFVVTNLAHLGDLLPMLARLRNSARVSRLGLVFGSWGRPILQLGHLADMVHIVEPPVQSRPWPHRRPSSPRHAEPRCGSCGLRIMMWR